MLRLDHFLAQVAGLGRRLDEREAVMKNILQQQQQEQAQAQAPRGEGGVRKDVLFEGSIFQGGKSSMCAFRKQDGMTQYLATKNCIHSEI